MERFWAKVERGEGCWIWTGTRSTHKTPYGTFKIHGKLAYAHRFALALDGRSVPDGWHTDHLCRNTLCVNPAHLEAVPPRKNAERGIKGVLTTHCPQGHAYDAENTRWKRTRTGRSRVCRTCHRDRERVRRADYDGETDEDGKPVDADEFAEHVQTKREERREAAIDRANDALAEMP